MAHVIDYRIHEGDIFGASFGESGADAILQAKQKISALK
jgi:hypothetical protein